MSLSVLIGVCTYRRTSVAQTIASLAAMDIPSGVTVALCVADNDSEASARERVETAAKCFPGAVHYTHAPESNISIARNAVLDKAAELGCDRLLFLDDDETVPAQWLAALIEVQQQTGAAFVVGPVLASYLPDAPQWMQNGRFHDTFPDVDDAGFAHTGYTCNLLLDLRDPQVASLRFDLRRGRSGGEDSAFSHAYQQSGGKIAFARHAEVYETVPPDRLCLNWLLQRRFRMGQTHGDLISNGRQLPLRLGQAGIATAKCLACLGLAALSAVDPVQRNKAIIRGTLHAGAVSGILGGRSLEIYGKADPLKEKKR